MTEEQRLARIAEIRAQFTDAARADDITNVFAVYDMAVATLTDLNDAVNELLTPVRDARAELHDLGPLPDYIQREHSGAAALVIDNIVWPDGGTNLMANALFTVLFGNSGRGEWPTSSEGIFYQLKRLSSPNSGPQPDGKWSAVDFLHTTRAQLIAHGD